MENGLLVNSIIKVGNWICFFEINLLNLLGPPMPQGFAYQSLSPVGDGQVALIGGYNPIGEESFVGNIFIFQCSNEDCKFETEWNSDVLRYGHVAIPIETGNPCD